MAEKKSSSGKKPPPQGETAEGGGTAASRLRSMVIAELTSRLTDPLLEDILTKGGLFTPGGPDCSGDCKGNCHGQCETSCRGECTGTCGGNCKGQCTGDCKNTACKGDCALSAKADRPGIPMPDDVIGNYIITVIGPTIEALKLALLKEGFPR